MHDYQFITSSSLLSVPYGVSLQLSNHVHPVRKMPIHLIPLTPLHSTPPLLLCVLRPSFLTSFFLCSHLLSFLFLFPPSVIPPLILSPSLSTSVSLSLSLLLLSHLTGSSLFAAVYNIIFTRQLSHILNLQDMKMIEKKRVEKE